MNVANKTGLKHVQVAYTLLIKQLPSLCNTRIVYYNDRLGRCCWNKLLCVLRNGKRCQHCFWSWAQKRRSFQCQTGVHGERSIAVPRFLLTYHVRYVVRSVELRRIGITAAEARELQPHSHIIQLYTLYPWDSFVSPSPPLSSPSPLCEERNRGIMISYVDHLFWQAKEARAVLYI